MGKKKLKGSKREVKIWICCKCEKRDVDIVKYNENGPSDSTFASIDTDDEDLLV